MLKDTSCEQKAKIEFSLECITPEMASTYLLRNNGNRGIRLNQVSKISRDMVSGNFEITHEAIAFDSRGNVIDGQHRLSAIVRSGVPVYIYVARYGFQVDETIALPINEGVKRTNADILKLSYRQIEVSRALLRSTRLKGNTVVPSTAEVADAYAKNASLIDEVIGFSHKTARYRSSAPVTAAMVMSISHNEIYATELKRQCSNFVRLEELDKMKPSILALIKWSDSPAANGASHRFTEAVCRSMIAFDPNRWNRANVRIGSMDAEIGRTELIAKRLVRSAN